VPLRALSTDSFKDDRATNREQNSKETIIQAFVISAEQGRMEDQRHLPFE
jgi:hypothetical protein